MHLRGRHAASIAAWALSFSTSAVLADTLVLPASADATIYQYVATDGDLANGGGEFLFAGNNNLGQIRRALIRFDLASIPAGSTVTSVTLRLRVSRTLAPAENVSLHRLLLAWSEGASNPLNNEGQGATPGAGDVTWRHRTWPTSLWASNGGDYAAASATTLVGGASQFYTWSSPALVADVQGWLEAPASNFGWIVRGPEIGAQTAKRFDGRTVATAANRPQLTVVFTPPGPPGACCLGAGGCAELSATTCSLQGGTFFGEGSSCTPDPCPEPTGACCAADATCGASTMMDCMAGGGSYQGNGTACEPGLCPVLLTPFVDALPIPEVALPDLGSPGAAATYTIAITEFTQPLHRDLPPTRLWGYGGSFPGPTIEAATGQPVTVTWINDLRDGLGNLRAHHLLPVDTCLHGPDMEGDSARTVVHLHGGHVPAAYDGYPEWTQLPGEETVYVYPNDQLPATLWYHDHALGITRLNVYLGLAGFYLVRDAFEAGLGLPSGPYEIPLAVQDRSFQADGSLVYPAAWEEHFFGNTILVNGKVWPYLGVDRGKYRFRLLNGSGSRTLRLALSNGATFWQVGTDGGLLPAPVASTAVTLGPAERADLVVDFAPYSPGTEILLVNDAPAPYPGSPGVGVVANVMKFVVGSAPGHTAALPGTLRPLETLPESSAVLERSFELKQVPEACAGSMWMIDDHHWDHITEYPQLDTAEIWSFVNRSGITHPMHMHLVMFQVLDRQDFDVVNGEVVPVGPRVPPAAGEAGWKDTVQAHPGQITRVIARFDDFKGRFAYHCHILEHEDHGMMRQFETIRCGDGALDPTETCDAGDAALGDGCSAACRREAFVSLTGTANGGSVLVVIASIAVNITTTPGQSAAQVAAALAAAIEANTTLAAAGVTALSRGGDVIVEGAIASVVVTDSGLKAGLRLVPGRTGLWWSAVGTTASYDVVRGDLDLLASSDGDFSTATLACVASNATTTWLDFAVTPPSGSGFWFLVRAGSGSYDSGAPSQVASRDAGIAASPGVCP